MPITPGSKLGSYVVQDFIGQGAMGVVYRAYHPQLERTGAVKVLQGLSPDPDSAARFRREAQAIARMRHPNIVNVFDFGEFDGTPYMIVEYVDGGNLSARLKSRPVDVHSAIAYLRGIGEALDYAHALGIVHRDVKPANVLLSPDNTPILADFGLVKLMQSTSVKSMTGVTTGTPAYMAPEQVTGSQVGPAADRYSMAVMAYEMLTGTLPFDDGGVLEVLYAHVHRDPPPPSSRNSTLGPRVDAVIARGMAKDPGARWESCRAFVAALDDAVRANPAMRTEDTVAFMPPMPRGISVASSPAPALAAAAVLEAPPPAGLSASAPSTAVAMTPAPLVAKKRHRGRNALVAGGLIVVLLIVVFLFVATRPTSINISPSSTVQAGESVVLTASRVPKNQDGFFELRSAVHMYPFHADSNGDVIVQIVIPTDIASGDHQLSICWGNACHGQTVIHVSASLVSATPTASPITSSPGATPAAASISLASSIIHQHTGTDTVYGARFSGGRAVGIRFIQSENGVVTNVVVATAVVAGDGLFAKGFTIPRSAVPGQAYIRACDANNVCATMSVTVIA